MGNRRSSVPGDFSSARDMGNLRNVARQSRSQRGAALRRDRKPTHVLAVLIQLRRKFAHKGPYCNEYFLGFFLRIATLNMHAWISPSLLYRNQITAHFAEKFFISLPANPSSPWSLFKFAIDLSEITVPARCMLNPYRFRECLKSDLHNLSKQAR